MRNIYKSLFLIVAFVSTSFTFLGQTQTGPGGVGTSATIGYWFDASNLTLSNGDPLNSWDDKSGNGNNATQGTPANMPTFSSSSANFNGRPVISFDGGDFVNTGSIGMLNTSVTSWFSASKLGVPITGGTLRAICQNSMTLDAQAHGTYLNINQFVSHVRSAPNVFTFAANSPGLSAAQMQQKRILSSIWRANDNFDFFMDGGLVQTRTGCNANVGAHNFTRIGAASSATPAHFFRGEIAEVFAFSFELNRAQRSIVENYMSSKYDIPISNDRYSFESTHPEEIAGIGRVTGEQHLSARGTGIVEFSAVSLADNQFLLWGHQNGVLTTNTTNVPPSYIATLGESMTRTWRVAETGTTGDVTISFDLTGIMFGHPDDFQLLIDADGDFTSGTTTVAGTLVGNIVSFIVTGAQLNNGDFFTVANTNASVIRSIVSGQDWNQTSTWSCTCIPSSTNWVIVSDNHVVNLTDSRDVARLTINSNAELSIGSLGILNINENLNVIGTINSASSGMVNFNGTNLQTINTNGTINFGSVTINNSNDVVIQSGNFTQSGVLILTNGDLDLGGNRYTFLSSASGTASIDEMTGAGTILSMGDVRVQRFIPSGVAGYRNIGTPLTMMPLSEWDDEVFISGPGFPDGCAFSSNGCYRSARFWNATTQAYVGIADINELIVNGTATEIWLGDNLTSFGQRTLQSVGELDLSLTKNITIRNGWNLVANPFLSPIDFDDIVRNSAGTGNYHYVWDPSTNGFQFWDGGAQSASVGHLANGTLSSFQGFWVFHSGATTTITINQNSKRPRTSDLFLRQSEGFKSMDYFTVELSNPRLGQRINSGVKFNENYNLQKDEHDIPSLPSDMVDLQALSLFSKTADGLNVTVNSLPLQNDCYIIPMYYTSKDNGNLKLTFNNIPNGYSCILIDKELGIQRVVENFTEVEFFQSESINAFNRFDLKFEKDKNCEASDLMNNQGVTISTLGSDRLRMVFESSPTTYFVEITNMLGQKVFVSNSIDNSSLTQEFPVDLISGIYVVSLINEFGEKIASNKVFLSK